MTEYLTTKEAAAYLAVSLRTFGRLNANPETARILNASRITSRLIRYRRANLDLLISHFQQFADPPPLSQTRIPPMEAVTSLAKMEPWPKRKGAYYAKIGIEEGARPSAEPRPIRKSAVHRRTAHP